jgi:hypothetical protein
MAETKRYDIHNQGPVASACRHVDEPRGDLRERERTRPGRRHRTIHHATHHPTVASQSRDPFKPRTTNGLSSNRNACASYGCVGAGGGGD